MVASLGISVTDRYSVSMTSQHTEISDLSVVAEPDLQVWSAGNADDGLDPRLEIARLDSNTRVAIRDSRYPAAPALIFTRTHWDALLGIRPELVDLR